jgi:hypothetical protein
MVSKSVVLSGAPFLQLLCSGLTSSMFYPIIYSSIVFLFCVFF